MLNRRGFLGLTWKALVGLPAVTLAAQLVTGPSSVRAPNSQHYNFKPVDQIDSIYILGERAEYLSDALPGLSEPESIEWCVLEYNKTLIRMFDLLEQDQKNRHAQGFIDFVSDTGVSALRMLE